MSQSFKYARSRVFFACAFFMLLPKIAECQVFTDSNLPIVIINTDGAVDIPDDPRVLANMKIIYKGEGVQNFLTDQNTPGFLNYNGRIDIEIRGSSSQSLPKKGYGLTTRLADNVSNNNVSLLGMPAENDWVLNGLAFDPSLIRDYLSYNLSRQMGNYATRTAYCEVVINGVYKGLYLLQEKIKADTERVNITKIGITHNTLPNLSGGYITKADKTTGGDPVAFEMATNNAWNVSYIHDLPKPEEVTVPQHNYIYNEFLKLETAADTENVSLVNGYPTVIDVPSFIDFMISNEIASNADGYALSTFFHKDRNGKLRAGPIWDFNLTYGNDLFQWGYDRSHYNIWQFNDNGNIGSKFWTDLFNNATYKCYLSKRWNELIQPGKPLNLTSMNNFIDSTISTIAAAAAREEQLWGTVPDLEFEIATLKSFLSARVNWLTENLGSYAACNNVIVPPLVINKINYNPGTSTGFTNSNDQEFIEIKNAGTSTVDLSGIYFRGTGLVYQFPFGQTVAAGGSVFLASKAAVFQNRYGFAANAEFTRNLANSHQDLVLADAFGNTIDRVHYYDEGPWPAADGNGFYMQLSEIDLDNNIGDSWTAVSMDLLSTKNISTAATTLYPNPVIDELYLSGSTDSTELAIYDIAGRQVLYAKGLTDQKAVPVSGLSAGIYIVVVTTANSTASHKIVKQ